MNTALGESKLATRPKEKTKLVFKILLSGSGNEQYISCTENGFMTLSKAILFFRKCWCESRKRHFIIDTKIGFMPNIEKKIAFMKCKCGSGNGHCVRGIEIGYTPLRGNKTSI